MKAGAAPICASFEAGVHELSGVFLERTCSLRHHKIDCHGGKRRKTRRKGGSAEKDVLIITAKMAVKRHTTRRFTAGSKESVEGKKGRRKHKLHSNAHGKRCHLCGVDWTILARPMEMRHLRPLHTCAHALRHTTLTLTKCPALACRRHSRPPPFRSILLPYLYLHLHPLTDFPPFISLVRPFHLSFLHAYPPHHIPFMAPNLRFPPSQTHSDKKPLCQRLA